MIENHIGEQDSQVVKLRIKNGSTTNLSISSRGLSRAVLETDIYNISANQEVINGIKPKVSQIGEYVDNWEFTIGTKKYFIKVKFQIQIISRIILNQMNAFIAFPEYSITPRRHSLFFASIIIICF